MIKGLGRIILLATGGLMIALAIVFIVKNVQDISTMFNDWQGLFQKISQGDWSALGVFGSFLWQIFTIIVGLSAVFAGLGGHGGFWFTIFSLIMLGFFIYDIVTKAQGGLLNNWKDIVELIANFALQIAYIIGFLFLKYGNHREKKKLRNAR